MAAKPKKSVPKFKKHGFELVPILETLRSECEHLIKTLFPIKKENVNIDVNSDVNSDVNIEDEKEYFVTIDVSLQSELSYKDTIMNNLIELANHVILVDYERAIQLKRQYESVIKHAHLLLRIKELEKLTKEHEQKDQQSVSFLERFQAFFRKTEMTDLTNKVVNQLAKYKKDFDHYYN